MGVYESLPTDPKLYAFRVYKLTEGGLLSKSGINALSDFLIPPNEVYDNKIPFSDWITSNAGKTIILSVYSLTTRLIKDMSFKVNDSKGKEGFLGGVVRYENWVNAHKAVLHVVGVKPNSFAESKLNLKPFEDYIVGFRSDGKDILSLNKDDSDPLSILSTFVKENLGKQCVFYIYNNTIGPREVNSKIDDNIYFELGCDVAYGKIHEFPLDQKLPEEEVQIPVDNKSKDIEKIDNQKEVLKEQEEVSQDIKEKQKAETIIEKKDNVISIEKNETDNTESKVIVQSQNNESIKEQTVIQTSEPINETQKQTNEDNIDQQTIEDKIRIPKNEFL